LFLTSLINIWKRKAYDNKMRRLKGVKLLVRAARRIKGPLWVKEIKLVCFHMWHRFAAVNVFIFIILFIYFKAEIISYILFCILHNGYIFYFFLYNIYIFYSRMLFARINQILVFQFHFCHNGFYCSRK
jgi:hypothetical protein